MTVESSQEAVRAPLPIFAMFCKNYHFFLAEYVLLGCFLEACKKNYEKPLILSLKMAKWPRESIFSRHPKSRNFPNSNKLTALSWFELVLYWNVWLSVCLSVCHLSV